MWWGRSGKRGWGTVGSSDSKGGEREGRDSKGKDDSEGKDGNGDYKGGKTQAKVERVAILLQVIILRRQREKRDGGHRIDGRGTRIRSGRMKMTGSMSKEPGRGRRVQEQKGK